MRLEHANLSVHDAEAMARFPQNMAPDFRVCGESGTTTRGAPDRYSI